MTTTVQSTDEGKSGNSPNLFAVIAPGTISILLIGCCCILWIRWRRKSLSGKNRRGMNTTEPKTTDMRRRSTIVCRQYVSEPTLAFYTKGKRFESSKERPSSGLEYGFIPNSKTPVYQNLTSFGTARYENLSLFSSFQDQEAPAGAHVKIGSQFYKDVASSTGTLTSIEDKITELLTTEEIIFAKDLASLEDELLGTLKREILASSKQGLIQRRNSELYEHMAQQFQEKKKYFNQEQITRVEKIGQGTFGVVYKSILKTGGEKCKVIAVKEMLSTFGPTPQYKDFLHEAFTMMDLWHPNVLNLFGISFSKCGSPQILTPFMEDGDLRTYLLRNEAAVSNTDLIDCALQIAEGMSYLGTKHVVHRDLAARNCMLSHQNGYINVKVADFGLSRLLCDKGYYRMGKGKNPPLPTRWMALESVSEGRFSVASDIWSYGVVLWEMWTFGSVPYVTIPAHHLASYLSNDYNRLHQPDRCPKNVYKIMWSCWNKNINMRPPFGVTIKTLEEMQTASNKTYKTVSYCKNPL